jgi:hypothetical protein
VRVRAAAPDAVGSASDFLADCDAEAGEKPDPGRAREAGGREQLAELLGRVEADPAGVGPARDRRREPGVPLRPGVDDAVDAAGPKTTEDLGRGAGRLRVVVVREAVVDEVEPFR